MGDPIKEDRSGGEKEQHSDCGQDVGYVVGFSGLHSSYRLSDRSFTLKRPASTSSLRTAAIVPTLPSP